MSKSFQDLVAFQRAMDVVVAVYDVSSRFPSHEKFGLVSQVRRAAMGVPAQIAEGQGRLTYGEWRQFLSQARGSLFEVEAELLAAERLHFATADDLSECRIRIRRAGRALAGLIRWVQQRERATAKRKHAATQRPSNPAT